MLATARHGGNGEWTEPFGYGFQFSIHDREKYFDRSWIEAIFELDGAGTAAIKLRDAFWLRCTELRSADIGRWLLVSGVAPWKKGSPPGIVVDHIEGNRFTARIQVRKELPGF
jgi:hypothetical protein